MKINKSLFSSLMNMREQFKGASTKDRSLKDLGGDYLVSADNMILDDLPVLRQRSRNLYNNVAIAKGIVNAIKDFESNYKLVSTINSNQDLKDFVNNKFKEYSKNMSWDNKTLDEFVNLYKTNLILDGEVFIKVFDEERRRSEFRTCFQIFSPDRIFTPSDKRKETENVIDGIQKDEFGRSIGFWYLKFQPNKYTDNNGSNFGLHKTFNENTTYHLNYSSKDFTYIPFYTPEDNLNALHIFKQDFPEQTRGVPYLASIITEINNYAGYNKTEWVRRRAASSIGVVITTMEPVANANRQVTNLDDILDSSSCLDSTSSSYCITDTTGCCDSTSEYLDISLNQLSNCIPQKREQVMRPGGIMYLKPGEKVETVNLQGPDAGVYESFTNNSIMNMASAINLPAFLFYPDLGKLNFSSGKLGLNRYKLTLNDTQSFDNDKLLVHIYENFITELISLYPEMFNNIDMKEVYSYEWFGPVVPDVDIQRETAATVEGLNNNLLTLTEYYSSRGQDFEETMKLRANELKFMESLGLSVPRGTSDGQSIEPLTDKTDLTSVQENEMLKKKQEAEAIEAKNKNISLGLNI